MDKAVIAMWPYSQNLMEAKGFEENTYLINTEEGISEYGSSAYVVNEDWYNAYVNGMLDHVEVNEFANVDTVDDDMDFLSSLRLVFPQPYKSKQQK